MCLQISPRCTALEEASDSRSLQGSLHDYWHFPNEFKKQFGLNRRQQSTEEKLSGLERRILLHFVRDSVSAKRRPKRLQVRIAQGHQSELRFVIDGSLQVRFRSSFREAIRLNCTDLPNRRDCATSRETGKSRSDESICPGRSGNCAAPTGGCSACFPWPSEKRNTRSERSPASDASGPCSPFVSLLARRTVARISTNEHLKFTDPLPKSSVRTARLSGGRAPDR